MIENLGFVLLIQDASTSQRIASCASRGGKGAADVVCRFSWRRSLNESDQSRQAKPINVVNETLGLISTNGPPKVTINENKSNEADAGKPGHQTKQNCFAVTPQPRTTIL